MKEVDTTEASGLDGLPNSFLKSATESFSKSLPIIFTKSKQLGIFPEQWKHATISPLHKERAKDRTDNYRPLAILSCASKIFEKCISEKLYEVISQYDFRRGRLCTLQLLKWLNLIYREREMRDQGYIFRLTKSIR